MASGRTMAAWMVAALLAGGLAGCASDNSSSSGPPVTLEVLPAQTRSDVADVPLPAGFTIVENKSNAYQTGNVRYVSNYYQGRKGKDVVASFFWDNMAQAKWRQDGMWKTRGTWRLHFAKGNERATVTVEENLWGTTTVHVEVCPVTLAPSGPGK